MPQNPDENLHYNPPSLATRVANLLANIPQLPESRRSFAQSMCDQFARRGTLSSAQEHWVDTLNEIARGTQNVPVVAQVGNLAGIRQMFDRASSRLRFPAIVLSVPAVGNLTIRLSVATERSRTPGAINVTAPELRDSYGRPTWFGRILQDGTFVGTSRLPQAQVEPVVNRLTEFAADPARIAGEHGRLTGRCCFCNLRLTDERSTATGYGPVCAGHYGLPWGAREVAETANETTAPVFDGADITSTTTPGNSVERMVVVEARPPRRLRRRVPTPAYRPLSAQYTPAPPASASRIDDMPLGPVLGELE